MIARPVTIEAPAPFRVPRHWEKPRLKSGLSSLDPSGRKQGALIVTKDRAKKTLHSEFWLPNSAVLSPKRHPGLVHGAKQRLVTAH